MDATRFEKSIDGHVLTFKKELLLCHVEVVRALQAENYALREQLGRPREEFLEHQAFIPHDILVTPGRDVKASLACCSFRESFPSYSQRQGLREMAINSNSHRGWAGNGTVQQQPVLRGRNHDVAELPINGHVGPDPLVTSSINPPGFGPLLADGGVLEWMPAEVRRAQDVTLQKVAEAHTPPWARRMMKEIESLSTVSEVTRNQGGRSTQPASSKDEGGEGELFAIRNQGGKKEHSAISKSEGDGKAAPSIKSNEEVQLVGILHKHKDKAPPANKDGEESQGKPTSKSAPAIGHQKIHEKSAKTEKSAAKSVKQGVSFGEGFASSVQVYQVANTEEIVNNWARLTDGLLAKDEEDTVVQIDCGYTKRDFWQRKDGTTWNCLAASLKPKRVTVSPNMRRKRPGNDLLYMHSKLESNTCFRHFMVHPDSRLSMAHAVLCTAMICWDLFFFPIQIAFRDNTTFFRIVGLVTTIFWTFDMPFSFVRGYYSNGLVEMRPRRVACNYVRSWFFVDFIVISSDWLSTILELVLSANTDVDDMMQITRSFKYHRLLRIGRVLRLVKVFHVIKIYIDGAFSELMFVVARLASLVICILLVNHYVACAWFALAYYNDDARITWIQQASLQWSDKPGLYIVALHWALTQFTPSTNNIAPSNSSERVFAIIVVLFALVTFSSFLSQLTNAMMQIKQIHLARHTEESKIRTFLTDRCVPLDFARQIWHFYRRHYRKSAKRIHYREVEFLNKLPNGLRMKLNDFLIMPILTRHCVFDAFAKLDFQTVLSICDVALFEITLEEQQDVFSLGDSAQHMYILLRGSMWYETLSYSNIVLLEAEDGIKDVKRTVSGGMQMVSRGSEESDTPEHEVRNATSIVFISELAIWSKWVHCGNLCTHNKCEMMRVDAEQVIKVCEQRGDKQAVNSLRMYASLYLQYVASTHDGPLAITDIVHFNYKAAHAAQMEKMVHEAFPEVQRLCAEPSETMASLQSLQEESWMSRLSHAATPMLKRLQSPKSMIWQSSTTKDLSSSTTKDLSKD